MRYETILKKLLEIKKAKSGKEAKEKLDHLIQSIQFKIEEDRRKKEKYGKAIQHLIGWYKQLWNNKPPESFGRTDLAVVGKVFRELLIIYENNNLTVEDIKKDYENFLKGNKIPNFLLGDKSITRFKSVLPQLKQLWEKSTEQKKWTSPENERGLDYYLKAIQTDEDEDVPF